MTSSSKKKKKKKADFQKVKLKVGRRLPKGQNITNTSFQTRKIQIREQIPNEQATVSAKKKVKLEELLNNLNHYNNSSRQNAITSLKELLSSEEDLIGKYLSSIIQAVSKLIEDQICEIRKCAQSVLKLILTKSNCNQLSPIFPLLGAYLCCGMTHVEPSIQYDSLVFLDIILEHAPEMLVDINPQILSNFLEQISRKSQAPSGNVASRTLLINPDREYTGHSWRLQVLQRVEKFLSVNLKHINSNQNGKCKESLKIHWDSKGRRIPHPDSQLQRNFTFEGAHTMKSVLNQRTKNLLQDENELKSFISSLLPLLFETWVEASPVQYVKNTPGNVLPIESFEMLTCLVEILRLLLDCVQCQENCENRISLKNWYQEVFEKQFLDYFMKNFPYAYQHATKKVRFVTNGIPVKVQCFSLNLSLCNIFTKLVSADTEQTTKYKDKIITFLTTLLESPDSKLSLGNTKSFMEVFKVVLQTTGFEDKTETLLDVAFASYQNENTLKRKKSLVFDLFSLIVLSPSKAGLSSNVLTRWLLLLPNELSCSETQVKVIAVIHKLARQNNEAVLSSLQSQKSKMIELLSNIPNEEENDEMHVQLIELLLSIKYLEKSDYETLVHCVRNHKISTGLRLYYLEVLSLRFQRTTAYYRGLEAANYSSFLMGVLLGFSKIEIENCKLNNNSDKEMLPLFVDVLQPAWETPYWLNHEKLVDRVIICFNDFENVDQMKSVVWTYLEKYWCSYSTFPLEVSWSILKLVSKLKLDIRKSQQFIEFVAATFYAEVVRGNVEGIHKWFSEVELIIVQVIGIFVRTLKDIVAESTADNISSLFANILQSEGLPVQSLKIIRDASNVLKLKLKERLHDSQGWHSLMYELSLKSDVQLDY